MKTLLSLLLALTLLGSSTHEPRRPGGKDYALFIAVEQYDNSSAWKKLPGLIQECNDLRNDLVSRYGFSEESKVLENPGLSEIMAELDRWRNRAYGPDDQLLIFSAATGSLLTTCRRAFLSRATAGRALRILPCASGIRWCNCRGISTRFRANTSCWR